MDRPLAVAVPARDAPPPFNPKNPRDLADEAEQNAVRRDLAAGDTALPAPLAGASRG